MEAVLGGALSTTLEFWLNLQANRPGIVAFSADHGGTGDGDTAVGKTAWLVDHGDASPSEIRFALVRRRLPRRAPPGLAAPGRGTLAARLLVQPPAHLVLVTLDVQRQQPVQHRARPVAEQQLRRWRNSTISPGSEGWMAGIKVSGWLSTRRRCRCGSWIWICTASSAMASRPTPPGSGRRCRAEGVD